MVPEAQPVIQEPEQPKDPFLEELHALGKTGQLSEEEEKFAVDKYSSEDKKMKMI